MNAQADAAMRRAIHRGTLAQLMRAIHVRARSLMGERMFVVMAPGDPCALVPTQPLARCA